MKYRLSFYKRVMALAVFLFLSLPATIFSAPATSPACIDLTRGGLHQVLDAMWPSKLVIKSGEVETITEPGYYHILENIYGEIIIKADNVVIDLNGFTITGDGDEDAIISIDTQERRNILIKNGSIKGGGTELEESLRTGIGIEVGQGTSGLVLHDLNFSNLATAVSFEGTKEYEIGCCKVYNCFVTDCVGGYLLQNVVNSVFQENEVSSCEESGFELYSCRHNKFKHCMVIGVGNEHADDDTVAGYYTKDGIDNLFYECFAEGLYKGDSSGDDTQWCSKAVGFMFTGTEMESKIVDCLVDSISTYSWSNAFGIMLDITLNDKDTLEAEKGIQYWDSGLTFTVTDVAWSPRCGYIAMAENDGSYIIYKFDEQKRQFIDGGTYSGTAVYALAWSNGGRYLVVVKQGADPLVLTEVVVHDVDTSFQWVLDFDLPDPDRHIFTDVAWLNHSKRFIATGAPQGQDQGHLHIFLFDPQAATENTIRVLNTTTTTPSNVPEGGDVLAITPDDKYVAVGYSDGSVKIYRIDDLLDNDPPQDVAPVATLNTGSDAINSLDFNPVACCGRYFLLVGKDIVGGGALDVWEWKEGTAPTSPIKEAAPGFLPLSVKWYPTGKYFVAAGYDENDITKATKMYEFNPDDPTVLLSAYAIIDVVLKGRKFVDFSPCGKYLVAAGERQEGEGDEALNREIFPVGYSVAGCLVDQNKVANASSEMRCAMGIFGASACNCITRNVSYNNCVNFSQGVYNVFYNGLAGPHGPQGNWSIPPY